MCVDGQTVIVVAIAIAFLIYLIVSWKQDREMDKYMRKRIDEAMNERRKRGD